MDTPSEHATALAFFALEHAMGSLAATKGPLVPFVMSDRGNQRKLRRFVDERPSERAKLAREMATSEVDVDRAAIALEGFVTLDGKRTEAVIVEVFEAGGERSYIFGQRFRPGTIFRKPKPFGNPTLVGYGEPFFAAERANILESDGGRE